MRETLPLLRVLAVAAAVGAWAVIVLGGYVSQTSSGLGCSELIPCGSPSNPANPGAAVIEATHRVAAWIEGFLVLGLLVLVLWRYRAWARVRDLTVLSFVLIVLQAVLGIVAVATALNPLIVTGHLGVATGFLAVAVLNAATIVRSAPLASAATSPPALDAPTLE